MSRLFQGCFQLLYLFFLSPDVLLHGTQLTLPLTTNELLSSQLALRIRQLRIVEVKLLKNNLLFFGANLISNNLIIQCIVLQFNKQIRTCEFCDLGVGKILGEVLLKRFFVIGRGLEKTSRGRVQGDWL